MIIMALFGVAVLSVGMFTDVFPERVHDLFIALGAIIAALGVLGVWLDSPRKK